MARCPIDDSLAEVIYLRDDEIPGLRNPLGRFRPVALRCPNGHIFDAVYEYDPILKYDKLIGFREQKTGNFYSLREVKYYEKGAVRDAYMRESYKKQVEPLIRLIAKEIAEEFRKIEAKEIADEVVNRIRRMRFERLLSDREVFRLAMNILDIIENRILTDKDFIKRLKERLKEFKE